MPPLKMEETQNIVFQITDTVSGRRCALRIDPADGRLPLGRLLDQYLKSPPFDRLKAEKRITSESAETLASIQDLVYISADDGRLHGMFSGIVFKQGLLDLSMEEPPQIEPIRLDDKEALLIDLTIDRTSVDYDRNWVGFNTRRWARHADLYSAFVLECLEEEFGPAEAQDLLEPDSTDSSLELVQALAKRIWDADFENYSRFVGRSLVYKSGDETVRSIIDGSGGICSEKVQALKFLTDHYGLKSEYVLAGADVPQPVPEAKLRELLTTFDFRFAKRYMRYWQHIALLYTVDGTSALVDATNGNIPFLFLQDSSADQLLGYDSKAPVRVKMAVNEEDFYYHRVSQDIPESLYFAMEGWVPYVDLVQVFDNELGLYISKDFMVTPIVFRNSETFDRIKRQYLNVCERAGLQCSISADWDLDPELGQRFAEQEPLVAEKVLLAKEHLLDRYDDCHGAGHEARLVVIGLSN